MSPVQNDKQGLDEQADVFEDLFLPPSKVKILKSFIELTDMHVTAGDVAKNANIDQSTFYRNIDDLLELGVVTKTEEKNERQFYKFNSSNNLSKLLVELYNYPSIQENNTSTALRDQFYTYWESLYNHIISNEHRQKVLKILISQQKSVITATGLAELISEERGEEYSAHNLVASSILNTFERFGIIFRIPKVSNPNARVIYIPESIRDWLNGNIQFLPNDPPTGPARGIISYLADELSTEKTPNLEALLYGYIFTYCTDSDPNIEVSMGTPEKKTDDPWEEAYSEYLIKGKIRSESFKTDDNKKIGESILIFLTDLTAVAWNPNGQNSHGDTVHKLNNIESDNPDASIDELLDDPSTDYLPLEVFIKEINVLEKQKTIEFRSYLRIKK